MLYGEDDVQPGDASASAKIVIDGKELPRGGCLGEARTRLYGSPAEESRFVLADRLAIVTSQEAAADPRVAQYLADWSACMKDRGFVFKDINTIMTAFERAPDSKASPQEIMTAVTDIECKKKTGLVRKWRLIGIEKEKVALEKNQLALTEERKDLDSALTKAAVVLEKNL